MSDAIRLRAPGPIHARLRPPGSKSLSNRALLMAAMAVGDSQIRGCLDAEDTQLMLGCFEQLGIAVELEGETLADGLRVRGSGPDMGSRAQAGELFVGTAGTVARFLTAALAAAPSPSWPSLRIDGTARMRERPMGALLSALVEQGAQIDFEGARGLLPIVIRPGGMSGGEIVMQRPASSQFVSALAIAGSFGRAPTRLVLRGGTPARPYVDMTLRVLREFGGDARWTGDEEITIIPASLRACDYVVEPDASAASYLLTLPAIYGGEVTIPDLGRDSLQGDAKFCEVLARMGARASQDATTTTVGAGGSGLSGIELDLSDMPDMTLTVAVAALFAQGETKVRGVEILRHHESDRIAAGATELRKLGATVVEHEGGMDIIPPEGGPRRGVEIDTYLDHRMAMAFAMAGDVEIRDPGCAAKTFPSYFEVLGQLGMVE